MLYVFGFDKVGVVLGDLYFVDPDPLPGQESPERGVRLEVRLLEEGLVEGSIYASRPIEIGRPIWRADLLETADGPPGTFNRTHHHPHYRLWEPSERVFDEELSADPITWVSKVLGNLEALADRAGVPGSELGAHDAEQLAEAVPEIRDTLARLLARVHSGELATAPVSEAPTSARMGWL